MSSQSLSVQIKHAGKTQSLSLDTSQSPMVFKEAVYHLTGVPVDRMKIMVKGGVLKDDADWKKIGPKANQTFMVIGAAGELPKPPEKPIVFLEDMDDSELAAALSIPVGLMNLGNTCYMNSTLQALRAIPELRTALSKSNALADDMPASLSRLYEDMSRTSGAVIPSQFLTHLRRFAPQFAEMSSAGKGQMGYAQQDAEECWVQMLTALKDVPGEPGPSGAISRKKFVEQYMMGEMQRTLKCDESPEEPPTVVSELVGNIKCNISITTNYMHTGLMEALSTAVEKYSPSLNREAVYTQTSRMTRLPTYLTVHMVRFAWRRDINKKAKIMRKVKFPLEFDALDLTTDELKSKMLPVSRKLKDIERSRGERRKVRARTKARVEAAVTAATGTNDQMPQAEAEPSTEHPVGAELGEESTYRAEEQALLMSLVAPDLAEDVGCSASGLYDLVAIVTHKGANADGGHYMGFVKKNVFHASDPQFNESDEDWYKFDDEKVSTFPAEKLMSLDGGGEDSSAYVLLYRSKSLD